MLSILLAAGRTQEEGKLGMAHYRRQTARRGILPSNIVDVFLKRKPPFLQLLLCGTPATGALMSGTPLEIYAVGRIKGMADEMSVWGLGKLGLI